LSTDDRIEGRPSTPVLAWAGPGVAGPPGTQGVRVISYRYLGTYSEARGRHNAEGWLTVRSDMRGRAGLLAAPLGVALLDTAGINVDPLGGYPAPTRIDLQLFEPALDVAQVHLEGRVLREGRTQLFTESRLTDANDRARVLGIGSTHWAAHQPVSDFQYVDNRPGVEDSPGLPPLFEAFGARRRPDGNLEIPELVSEIGSDLSGSGLHQGPFQVVPEAAAMIAAQDALGTDCFWIEHQGTSLVSRGIRAPLVTSAEVLRVTEDQVTVRVELRSEGADDRLCSVTVCRFRLA
jgi:acyl-coenzyme A thioesterase PaaI-like protein